MTPFGFASVHVRHVNFDEWNRDGAQRIANRETAVRIGAGVDDDAVDFAAQRVYDIDQLAFSAVLRKPYLSTELARNRRQRSLDVRERLPAVKLRFTRAEEIQVRAIDDRDPHVFFNPLSHALNCAMSSVPSAGGVLEFGGDADGEFASPEKN